MIVDTGKRLKRLTGSLLLQKYINLNALNKALWRIFNISRILVDR